MNELSERFQKLFAGADHVHGEWEKDSQKTVAKTVREPVTPDLWSDHLEGRRNLGIVPVARDMTCGWGAVDLDGPVDAAKLAAHVQRLGMPFVVCRSKSGGAHLFMFAKPRPAEEVQDEIHYLAKRLGHSRAEVFPKQTRILFDRGDVGSWLLMPYFNARHSDRHAVDATGKILSAAEFLSVAEVMREEY